MSVDFRTKYSVAGPNAVQLSTPAHTEAQTRPLDERVARFCKQYADDFTVFDTHDYELPGISDEFRWMLSPVVLNAILSRVSKNFEQIRDHSLDIRRYYRKVEY